MKNDINIGEALVKTGKTDSSGLIKDLMKSYGDKNMSIGFTESEVLPTGCLELDIGLSYGGLLTGKLVSIAGGYGSGKTQLCFSLIKNIQAEGRKAAFIDTENSFNAKWAAQNGVDVDSLLYLKAFNLETAGDLCTDIARSKEYSLIVLDSIAGAPTQSEVEGEAGDSNIGRRAKVMSTVLPKLNGAVMQNNCWMILVNQVRKTISMYPKTYMPGGEMQYYLSSTVLYLNGDKKEIDNGYINVTAKIDKHRGVIMDKSVEYKLYVREPIIGFNLPEALANVAEKRTEELGIIKGGAWYTLPEGLFTDLSGNDLKFQGKAKLAEFFTENKEKAVIFEKYVKDLLLK